MKHFWAIIVGIIVLSFALPTLTSALESLLPVLSAGVLLVAIGGVLFRRYRRW